MTEKTNEPYWRDSTDRSSVKIPRLVVIKQPCFKMCASRERTMNHWFTCCRRKRQHKWLPGPLGSRHLWKTESTLRWLQENKSPVRQRKEMLYYWYVYKMLIMKMTITVCCESSHCTNLLVRFFLFFIYLISVLYIVKKNKLYIHP